MVDPEFHELASSANQDTMSNSHQTAFTREGISTPYQGSAAHCRLFKNVHGITGQAFFLQSFSNTSAE